MAWTKEQQQAFETTGKNIIVSAGAGSGKTAVLTKRVINHLHNNIHINELLILTFTNAAAKEMKERIRSSIKSDETLKEELKKIDEAYITTFDAFSLAIVKKYHYLLNLPSNPKITDDTLINILKRNTLREVINEYYEQEDSEFLNLIDMFCQKDDTFIFNELSNVINALDNMGSVRDFLETYTFKKENFSYYYDLYEKLVLRKKNELIYLCDNLLTKVDEDYYQNLLFFRDTLNKATSYQQLYEIKSIKLPILKKNIDEEIKVLKEQLAGKLKNFKNYFRFQTKDDLEKSYLDMEKIINIIVKILKTYFQKYEQLKKEKGYFDFATIFNYALNLLENYPFVLEELKSSFKEIMVDEYQDTNDVQEKLLNLLGNNNVYMVGDIKQSIYRFRNANPYLFKDKYDNYKQNMGGIKIDLLKNFRSRKEVIHNINQIFILIMDNFIGGANYLEDQTMSFGNLEYEEQKDKTKDYFMECVTYPLFDTFNFSKEEIEAFYIGKRIKKMVQEKFPVYDKDKKILRDVSYKDFCILIDRTTSFDLYKKVFDYLEIPLLVLKDETLSANIHFLTIKNLFVLLTKLDSREYDDDFKYSFVSLARSFLFSLTDEEIYETLNNHDWYNSKVIKTLKNVLDNIKAKSLKQIFEELLKETNYYEKLILIGNISASLIILENLENKALECSEFGFTYKEFVSYLQEIIKENISVKYRDIKPNNNEVEIMTIHKSKGLEFPICFYAGLYKNFNLQELNNHFFFHKDFSFVVPLMNEGLMDTFLKDLIKDKTLKEEISEKIRLFYVALTRAKEKMIFVYPNTSFKESIKEQGIICDYNRLEYRNFLNILESIDEVVKPYKKIISLEELGLTKDYLKRKEKNLQLDNKIIKVNELDTNVTIKKEEKYSKTIKSLLTTKEKKDICLGNELHEILKYFDFQKPNFSLITNEYYQGKIKSLYYNPLIQNNLKGKFYQEYEFYYESDDVMHHGIIDLFIVLDKEIILIDYKLLKVNDENYLKQLKGYKQYLWDTFKLNVKAYLYSLLEEQAIFLDI